MAASPKLLNLDKWDFSHINSVLKELDDRAQFNGTLTNGDYRCTVKYLGGDDCHHIVTKIERV